MSTTHPVSTNGRIPWTTMLMFGMWLLFFLAPSIRVELVAADEDKRKGDWPQFLGPNRDGVYSGPDITEAEPELIWKKNIGEGE